MKRVFLGIGIGGIGLWMAGCTDETAQEPDNIYNTYMAGGMEEALAADCLAAPGSNAPADLVKYVSELSCANFIWNNYQYTDLGEMKDKGIIKERDVYENCSVGWRDQPGEGCVPELRRHDLQGA